MLPVIKGNILGDISEANFSSIYINSLLSSKVNETHYPQTFHHDLPYILA